jgi:hypothetical protein
VELPAEAMEAFRRLYRYDRTDGQDYLLVLGGEKATCWPS